MRNRKHKFRLDDRFEVYDVLLPTHLPRTDIPLVRKDTDETLLIQKWQYGLFVKLQKGKPLRDGTEGAALSDETTQFLNMLRDAGFIKSINGKTIPDMSPKIEPWFIGLQKKHVAWLIAKPFVVFLFLFITSGFVLMSLHQSLLPIFSDFFWHEDILWVVGSIFLITTIVTGLHELGHFLVTKAVGAEARITLSTRLIYFTVETVHYYLALVPKHKRYLVYMSGAFAELTLGSIIMWILYLTSLPHPLLKVTLLIITTDLAWQFSAFIKTDLYNVLSEYLNQPNLYEDAKKKLAYTVSQSSSIFVQPIKKFLTKILLTKDVTTYADDFRTFSDHDRHDLQRYTYYVAGGLLLSTIYFTIFVFLRDMILFYNAISQLAIAFVQGNVFAIIKWIVVGILAIYLYGITAALIVKKVKEKDALI